MRQPGRGRIEIHPPLELKSKLERLRLEMSEKAGKPVPMNQLVVSILEQFFDENPSSL